MFKDLTIYRIAPLFVPELADIEAALAKAPFMECGATGLLQAVRSIAAITTCADQDPEAMCAEIQGVCREAMAKVTGGAA